MNQSNLVKSIVAPHLFSLWAPIYRSLLGRFSCRLVGILRSFSSQTHHYPKSGGPEEGCFHAFIPSVLTPYQRLGWLGLPQLWDRQPSALRPFFSPDLLFLGFWLLGETTLPRTKGDIGLVSRHLVHTRGEINGFPVCMFVGRRRKPFTVFYGTLCSPCFLGDSPSSRSLSNS